jgi:hypothetical protein
MNKLEALSKLNEFIERNKIEDEAEYLLGKYNQMGESDFDDCTSSGSVYHKIVGWAPKRKTVARKTQNQAYYAASIDRVTEKAYGFVTGSNNLHGNRYREYITWVAQSVCVDRDDKTYIPAWIISKDSLWDSIDKNDKINLG